MDMADMSIHYVLRSGMAVTLLFVFPVLGLILIRQMHREEQRSGYTKRKGRSNSEGRVSNKKVSREKLIQSFIKDCQPLSPAEFMARYKSTSSGLTGIYILYNATKGKCYIGQASNVYTRVYGHFTGRGCGDVYADYKYGDRWIIRLMGLRGSQYESLDELERHAITLFDSFDQGYNKTRGNGAADLHLSKNLNPVPPAKLKSILAPKSKMRTKVYG